LLSVVQLTSNDEFTLFTWNGEKQSKMQVFKGTVHNYQLIDELKTKHSNNNFTVI
jgi:hypothetical protein